MSSPRRNCRILFPPKKPYFVGDLETERAQFFVETFGGSLVAALFNDLVRLGESILGCSVFWKTYAYIDSFVIVRYGTPYSKNLLAIKLHLVGCRAPLLWPVALRESELR